MFVLFDLVWQVIYGLLYVYDLYRVFIQVNKYYFNFRLIIVLIYVFSVYYGDI